MSLKRQRRQWDEGDSNAFQDHARKDIQELRSLAKASRSLSEAAKRLSDLDLGKIDHSTLSRWLAPGRSNWPPRLSQLMAAYRRSDPGNRDGGPVLSFALPKTNLSISTLMAYSKYSSFDSDEEYFSNIKINRIGEFEIPKGFVRTEAGGQAFQLLIEGEVMFALGSPEVFVQDWQMRAEREWPKSIHELCQIAKGNVVGISEKQVEGIGDLANLTIGCPAASILPSRIRQKIQAQADPKVGQVRPYETPEMAGIALLENQIDTLIGLRSWVERARMASSPGGSRASKFYPLGKNWFGEMTYSAYVNINQKYFSPIAVRAYLKRLVEANSDNRVKLHLEELKNVLVEYTGREATRKAKGDFDEDSLNFNVSNINYNLILYLWKNMETSARK